MGCTWEQSQTFWHGHWESRCTAMRNYSGRRQVCDCSLVIIPVQRLLQTTIPAKNISYRIRWTVTRKIRCKIVSPLSRCRRAFLFGARNGTPRHWHGKKFPLLRLNFSNSGAWWSILRCLFKRFQRKSWRFRIVSMSPDHSKERRAPRRPHNICHHSRILWHTHRFRFIPTRTHIRNHSIFYCWIRTISPTYVYALKTPNVFFAVKQSTFV
jgi:hypothetical protein